MGTNKTTDSWIKEINDFSTLPESLQLEVNKILKVQDNKHPLALKVPANEKLELLETLLIIFNEEIFILEDHDGFIKVNKIDYSDINFMELSIILLNSNLILNDGNINKKIYFNTSSESFFHQLIEKVRTFKNQSISNDPSLENIDYLQEIDIKLYNYSKYALKFHQDLIDSVYQNRHDESEFGSSITLLTDNELIFIKEPDKENQPMDSLYGGQWIYISLDKIIDVTTENIKNENMFSLIIHFKDNHQYSINYDYMTKSSFKDFDKKILALI